MVLVIPQVRLMISDSELSDDFSLDTVGSHGRVKCKGRYKDYRVRCCYSHKFFFFFFPVYLQSFIFDSVVFDFRLE